MIEVFFLLGLLCFVAIFRVRKASHQADYLVAGRTTKFFPLVATLVMTEINPMALIAMATLGYLAGYWALGMAVNALIGPLFASVTTAKKWKNFNASCVSLLFDHYLGYMIGNFVRIILLISLLILSATYIKGVIVYFEVLFPQCSLVIVVVGILLFCVLSVIRNGLNGIIHMDVIGFILTSIFLSLLFAFSMHALQTSFAQTVHFTLTKSMHILPVKYLIALMVLQSVMYSIAPWWGQKIFSANNSRTAYQASLMSSCIIFLFYACVILCACFLRECGVEINNTATVFPVAITAFLPTQLKIFSTLVFILIASSTICGVWSAISGLISSGFMKKPDEATPEINYLIWLILSVITYFIAVYVIDGVLHAAVLAVMQICSLFFSVMAIFYWKKITRAAAMSSIMVSMLIGYLAFIHWGEQGDYIWHWVVMGIPAMFLSGYICLALNKSIA